MKNKKRGVSTVGRSIKEQIMDDLDDAMQEYLELKRAGWGSDDPDVQLKRGMVRGLALCVGRFGWSGVSSYEHMDGARAAEKQSMARVKERMRGRAV